MYKKREAAVKNHSRSVLFIFTALMHTMLAGWVGLRSSPVTDELGHFAAGVSHWQLRRFDLFSVNPPLPRLLATLPAALEGSTLQWAGYSPDPNDRAEFRLGRRFASDHPHSYLRIITFARWTYISLSILGMFVCYQWSSELYGRTAGNISIMLWCVSPTIITYSAAITPDLPAASLGVAACYQFRRWMLRSTWRDAVCFGVVLGLAELTKFTWLILYPAFTFLTLVHCYSPYRTLGGGATRLVQLSFAFLLSVYVINLGYGFQDSFRPLRDFQFYSTQLGGGENGHAGNHFRLSAFGNIPVPLPANMLVGIDFVKSEFERGYSSYLLGERRHGGWWYYYIYAMSVKMPIGTILLFACSGILFLRKFDRTLLLESSVLLTPALSVILAVSSQTGFNHHLRYVLPAFPFMFIFCGRSAALLHHSSCILRYLPTVLVTHVFISVLLIYPHTMSYFNELTLGPRNGWRHLDFSNIDWGQDMVFLSEWAAESPDKRPLYVSSKSPLSLKTLGIYGTAAVPIRNEGDLQRQFPPGWYALGAHQMLRPDSELEAFLELDVVNLVGYSIHIYHLTEPLLLSRKGLGSAR